MPISARDYMVKCPFFLADDYGRIHCEGPIDRTRLQIHFLEPSGGTSKKCHCEKLTYMDFYCNRDYKACLVYKMNEGKYE